MINISLREKAAYETYTIDLYYAKKRSLFKDCSLRTFINFELVLYANKDLLSQEQT